MRCGIAKCVVVSLLLRVGRRRLLKFARFWQVPPAVVEAGIGWMVASCTKIAWQVATPFLLLSPALGDAGRKWLMLLEAVKTLGSTGEPATAFSQLAGRCEMVGFGIDTIPDKSETLHSAATRGRTR